MPSVSELFPFGIPAMMINFEGAKPLPSFASGAIIKSRT